ncbi:MAG: SHOCT domain-containing protein [Rhizobiales bacterium]|nr:SHOCT domain-containing protein [Hyphomicrobiales bacterium]MBI3674366.1 SHOCT domain-containing protein [Hyphomicrobiales bacterium]
MKRILRLSAAALITAPAFLPNSAWAQTQPDTDRFAYGPRMMWWDGGGYEMIFGPLFMILILAVVIAVVVLLVQWLGGPWQGLQPPRHLPPGRTPLDILKERYAKGEINKDEFEERRRVLGD